MTSLTYFMCFRMSEIWHSTIYAHSLAKLFFYDHFFILINSTFAYLENYKSIESSLVTFSLYLFFGLQ